jgi:hypothetical protein
MNGEEHNRRYIAVIGDIRGSRGLEHREDVQEQFRQKVRTLNTQLPENAIASQGTVTTGDEFQILLGDATSAIEAAVWINDELHHLVKMRFGIGLGELETAINREQAIGMDGPCFHRAREAVDEAKQEGAWIRVRGWSNLDRRVNPMFDLVQSVREDWTDRQAEFARKLREVGTQKAVADHYEVTKSTVSQSLNSAHVRQVRNVENAVGELLEENGSPDRES